ncbi:MAG TPA: hypothetical protein PL033_00725 [Candidatus Brocadiia bacterium]|nr:hypothetical protein [Candidatus Brocadiia bacterium]
MRRHLVYLLAIAICMAACSSCKKSSPPSSSKTSGTDIAQTGRVERVSAGEKPGTTGGAAIDKSATAVQPPISGEFPQQTTPEGNIVIEAESFFAIEEPMVVAKMPDNPPRRGARGEVTYIWCPEGPGNKDISGGRGKALLRLRIPKDGEYWLWIRKNWPHSCGKTLDFVLRMGSQPGGAAVAEFTMSNNNYDIWEWVQWRTIDDAGKFHGINLKAEEYILEIKNHEDGSRIDKVLLTLDPQFYPVH